MLIYSLLVTIYLAYLAVVTREYCYGRQLWCMLSLGSFWSRRGAAIRRRAMGYEIKSSTLPGFTGDEGKGVEAGVRCLMEEGP